jgi:hypothetical protein
MYYIYHIPGVKIGCTDNIERRMKHQGFTEWEILETYEDGWVAGDREIELQKEYRLPVEKIHYMDRVEMLQKGISTSNKHILSATNNITIGREKITREHKVLGGIASTSQTRECPHCGVVYKMPSIFNHIKKCETNHSK